MSTFKEPALGWYTVPNGYIHLFAINPCAEAESKLCFNFYDKDLVFWHTDILNTAPCAWIY